MRRNGFTLIELLIVVAIIAILAAIAVPNFLEAQVRAKIARVKADQRTIALALESYAIDNNGRYPYLPGYKALNWSQWDRGGIGSATGLTTPIAYLSSVLIPDPFVPPQSKFGYYGIAGDINGTMTINITMIYMNIKLCRDIAKLKDDGRPKWILLSYGPDFRKGPDPRTGLDWGVGSYATSNADPAHHFDAWNYDSSNGTISGGDIIKHQ